MPKYVEDVCQLQSLINICFPSILLHGGGSFLKITFEDF